MRRFVGLAGQARCFLAACAGLVSLALSPAAAVAQNGTDPAFFVVGAGAFDFHDNEHRAAQGEIQYRSDLKLWVFNPMVGFSATTDGSIYAYAGISLDIFFGKRWVLRPSFAPGFYNAGGGKDLGHHLEFRSAIELSYRFEDRSRLGLEVYHRSNAGLGNENPGEESLMLTYAIPIGRLFGN
jgi:lipid A 3-O-deacylase